MKKFIIINGKSARIIQRESLDMAKQTAENICDHSKEVIVREVTEVIDNSKKR